MHALTYTRAHFELRVRCPGLCFLSLLAVVCALGVWSAWRVRRVPASIAPCGPLACCEDERGWGHLEHLPLGLC